MAKVWRYQNAEGKGPYTSEHVMKEELKEAHSNSRTHPVPSDYTGFGTHPRTGKVGPLMEFPKYPGEEYKYGFACKEHANIWFDGWEPYLVEKGFTLVEIEASEVIVSTSKKQVAFKP